MGHHRHRQYIISVDPVLCRGGVEDGDQSSPRHNNLATRTEIRNIGGQHGDKRWKQDGAGGPSLLTGADGESCEASAVGLPRELRSGASATAVRARGCDGKRIFRPQ